MKAAASLEKKLLFDQLIKTLEGKNYIFVSCFNRLSVNDFGELRRKLERVADRSLVVKNSVTRRVFDQMGIKGADDFFKGSVFLTVGEKEPQAVSKILVDFAKGNESFKLAGAYLDGAVLLASHVETLAKLPSREVLLTNILGGLNAPIQGFVSVLGQLVRSLVIALDQVHQKKAAQAS